MDDSGHKIYPEPAAQGTYDAQGRLAGYYHIDEEVPQSEEQEEELPSTTDGQRAFEVAHDVPRTALPVAAALGNVHEQSQSLELAQMASKINGNTQHQHGHFSSQQPRSPYPYPNTYGHNGQHHWNGSNHNDRQAPQPDSFAALAPSTDNEIMLQERGGMSFQYPAMSAASLSGASCLAFQKPTARMAPGPNANVDPLLLSLDHNVASERDRLNPSSSRQQSSKLIEPSTFEMYKSSLSRDEPHGNYPELPSTNPLPSGPANVAARPNNDTVASNLNATRQQFGWTTTPPPLPQQQTSGPDVNAPKVYGQGTQHGSLYGQHLLPPPPGTINPAVRQRDGSKLMLQQQQASGLDTIAPSVPYNTPINGYAHLSPSDPSPAEVAFATQYVCDNHLSSEIYSLVLAAYKGHPHLSADPLVAAAQLSDYHIARDQRNSTLKATFSGTLSGHVNHRIPVQNVGTQQPHQSPHPGFAPQLLHPDVAPPRPNPGSAPSPSTPNNATLPTPVKGETRPPGELVNTPLTPSVHLQAEALRALPQVNTNGWWHPRRSCLKKPFDSIEVATPGQLLIRDDFLSGQGTMRPEAKLMQWYGDEAVFSKVFWKFLVEGESRAKGVKRKRVAGGAKPKRQKIEGEEG